MKVKIKVDRPIVYAIQEYLNPHMYSNGEKCSDSAKKIVLDFLERFIKKAYKNAEPGDL